MDCSRGFTILERGLDSFQEEELSFCKLKLGTSEEMSDGGTVVVLFVLIHE